MFASLSVKFLRIESQRSVSAIVSMTSASAVACTEVGEATMVGVGECRSIVVVVAIVLGDSGSLGYESERGERGELYQEM